MLCEDNRMSPFWREENSVNVNIPVHVDMSTEPFLNEVGVNEDGVK